MKPAEETKEDLLLHLEEHRKYLERLNLMSQTPELQYRIERTQQIIKYREDLLKNF